MNSQTFWMGRHTPRQSLRESRIQGGWYSGEINRNIEVRKNIQQHQKTIVAPAAIIVAEEQTCRSRQRVKRITYRHQPCRNSGLTNRAALRCSHLLNQVFEHLRGVFHSIHVKRYGVRLEPEQGVHFCRKCLRIEAIRLKNTQSTQTLQPSRPVCLFILFFATEWHHEGWHMRPQNVHCGVVAALAD